MNEYSKFFNTNMSHEEARLMLFKLGERIGNQNKDEKDKIFSAYKEVSHIILEKEIDNGLAEIED